MGVLQEARKACGFTQQAVADHLEMARTTLVAIEKGERRVTPDELIKLAAFYGRRVSELVSRKRLLRGSFLNSGQRGKTFLLRTRSWKKVQSICNG